MTRKLLQASFSWWSSDLSAAVFSGQGSQIGNDRLDLLVRECRVQLRHAHFANGVIECCGAAVMKIGRCGCDVAQAGHSQNFRLRRSERVEDSVPLKEIAAYVDALVTGNATQ